MPDPAVPSPALSLEELRSHLDADALNAIFTVQDCKSGVASVDRPMDLLSDFLFIRDEMLNEALAPLGPDADGDHIAQQYQTIKRLTVALFSWLGTNKFYVGLALGAAIQARAEVDYEGVGVAAAKMAMRGRILSKELASDLSDYELDEIKVAELEALFE